MEGTGVVKVLGCVCVCVCVRGGRWLLHWPSRLLALSLEAFGRAGLELLDCKREKIRGPKKLWACQGRGDKFRGRCASGAGD